ncbi:MAG TPA: VanW family protein [Chloroflexota bacterium]|nr:VanW family protein [Chloroflexota bacterium]
MRTGTTLAFAAAVAAGVAAAAVLAMTALWTTHPTPSDHAEPNTTVADIEIAAVSPEQIGVSREESGVSRDESGGASRAQIRELVQARLERYADTPITLTTPDGELRFPARQLGYRPEVEATLAQIEALGAPLHRERLLAARSGADAPWEIRPSWSLDAATLNATVDGFAARFARPPVDAQLRVNPDVTVELIPSKAGQRVDRAELARRLQRAFAGLETATALPLEPTRPPLADADATEALKAAEQFVAAPLEVRAAGLSWTLTRGDLASWVVFERTGGPDTGLKLGLHPERPRNWLVDRAREVGRPAKDARVRLRNGQATVFSPEEAGQELDQPGSLAVLLASGRAAERRVDLPVRTLPPRVTAAEAAKLRFPDLLAEASTVYGGSIPERNHNVELATSRLDGVVVPSGATFSFNRSVGRTRIKDGYRMAFGITSSGDGVQTVPSVAGGICQVATTLFQGVFWAGLPVVERNWHTYWIAKYGRPPKGLTGLDATVDEDAGLDLRFTNTTGAPLLIQSSADGTRVSFRLHGAKPGWEVTTSGPSLSNFTRHDPTSVRQEDATLAAGRAIWIEEARDGFDALIVRTVVKGGSLVDRLEVRSSYAPSRNVVLVGTRR